MFGFLKDKLKGAVSIFKKKVDEEVAEEAEKQEDRLDDKKPIEKGKQKETADAQKESKLTQEKASKKQEKKETEEKKEENESAKANEGKKQGFFGKLFGRFKKEEVKEEGKKKDSAKAKAVTKKIKKDIKKITKDAKEEEKLEAEIDEEAKSGIVTVTSAADLGEAELKAVEIEERVPESAKITAVEKREIKKLEEDTLEEELIEDEIKQELGPEQEYEKIEAEKQESGADVVEIEKTIDEEVMNQKSDAKEELKHKKKEDALKKYIEEPEEGRGFLRKFTDSFTTKKISSEKFDELFWALEVALLESSVAVEVIEKIKSDLKEKLVGKPLPRKELEAIILTALRQSIDTLFIQEKIDIIESIRAKNKEGKPYVICFVGINGSGKTTTIAKFAHLLKKNDISSVIAAADTFRAAAIDQLEVHANNLGVKLIKHDYDADPAAVAFDAIKHAESKGKNAVLIDTAGRLHSNSNLMEELHKIVRVSKPDLTIFVGESITGNDCIEQAKEFDRMVKIDGIILSKADVDQKGGAAISISYVLNKPILYFGVGQNYEDLRPFSMDFINENLSF